MKNKRIPALLLALLLTLLVGCSGKTAASETAKTEETTAPQTEATSPEEPAEEPIEEPAEAPFRYVHDPRDNPEAMKDIVENPDAIYGFSPSPDSDRLASYVDFDWSDPEVVENGRQERIAYHESLDTLYDMLFQLRDEGKSIEEMARAVSTERNRLRLAAYTDNPEGLAAVKKSNLEKYGHEDGPTPDELYEKYGSWELVIQKAFGTNPGMDACLGLYDDYYDLYAELGMIA